MDERRLDTNRLHKLTETVVLLITAVAGVIAVWFGNSINNEKYFQKEYTHCDEVWSSSLDLLSSCRRAVEIEANQIFNTFLVSISVTVLLPILFFGGSALYRYLFPIKKGAEDS